MVQTQPLFFPNIGKVLAGWGRRIVMRQIPRTGCFSEISSRAVSRPDAPAASDGIGGGTQSASGVCYNPIFPTSRFANLPRYQN
ncbi:hypothetical protein NLA_17160 [Neisseria lactamica 020-06]|uniref:Uncharacterized protein n=2 Tax=Neisseria lactamica TaxID=486 RepID=E4ZEY5_NEIL0|nr:hypothetical protein B2G52_04500 [Neisseria lactamica]CBN87921.1 hypothetical protein NLA_17160 [Neisseria lactamica 020-06]